MTDKPCILLVESDFAIRHPLAEYLRECGYRVVEALTNDEAVILLGEPTLHIDVVLSGVKNPGRLDAFALTKWIRDNDSKTKVMLAATPAREAEKASQLCREGPQGDRPYHHQGLLDHIKQMMAKRDRGIAAAKSLPAGPG